MLSGVCTGIAAYLNIDPTFVRIAFVLLTVFWGTGVMVYILLALVIPEARSPEEKAAASGNPATAQEFIHRAKEGYYEAMKNFPDRKARREWSRQFRRDMRANANQWRRNWSSYWAEHAPVHPGMHLALPFLSLLNAIATVLFICLLISLLSTGSVFGRPIPGHLPIWGATIILVLVYGVLTGPLKQARHACYRGSGPPGKSWSLVFLLDSVIWLSVVAVLLCLTALFFPEVRHAIHSIPSIAHQAADEIRNWWHQN